MAEAIASLITLLIFFGAVIAPFIYLLYKQKEDRAEEAKRQAEVRRREGEAEPLDISAGEEYGRYSEPRSTESGESTRSRRGADGRGSSSRRGSFGSFSARGSRVENRPSSSQEAGREIYSTPEDAEEEKEEGLMSHIADFSSEGLSHRLETRYDDWDEVGTRADSRHHAGGGTKWPEQTYPSYSWKGPAGPSRPDEPGPRGTYTGEETVFMKRLSRLSPLKKAVVMAEILNRPKALRDDDGQLW
jgi:hypothetical protein